MDLSAGYLMTSMLVSTAGFACWRFGKKELRVPQVIVGIALMILPALVTGPLAMAGVAGAMLGGLWLGVRAGM